jgi:hypothetical protein
MASAPSLIALGPAVKWKIPHDVWSRGPGPGGAHSRVMADVRLCVDDADGCAAHVAVELTVPSLSILIPEIKIDRVVDRKTALNQLHGAMDRACGIVADFVHQNCPDWNRGSIQSELPSNGEIEGDDRVRVATAFAGATRDAWDRLQVRIAGWIQQEVALDDLAIIAMRQKRDGLGIELEWHVTVPHSLRASQHTRTVRRMLTPVTSIRTGSAPPGLSKLPR